VSCPSWQTSPATTTINLYPASVILRVAIGASVGLRLTATTADGAAFDLAPYTVTAPFSGKHGPVPPLAGWAVTVEDSAVLLTLSPADTLTLAPAGLSITWHWDVWLSNTLAPERLLYAHGDLSLLTP